MGELSAGAWLLLLGVDISCRSVLSGFIYDRKRSAALGDHVCLAYAPAGAVIKHQFSLVFRFCFGKPEPSKGEKARLNGSRTCFKRSARTERTHRGFTCLRKLSVRRARLQPCLRVVRKGLQPLGHGFSRLPDEILNTLKHSSQEIRRKSTNHWTYLRG
jgi:hypothetical protein